jgi:maleate isomerase
MDVVTSDLIDLGTLPCTLDAGAAHRAAIGLLVLATDATMESEFRRLVAIDGVATFHARLFNDIIITRQTLREIGDRITPATELLLPGLHLDVVAFGCTSASMELGEEEIFRQIRRARPGIACTTPVTAAFAAMEAFGARRVGVLTPYSAAVNANVRAYLGTRWDVAAFATYDKEDDSEVGRIDAASIAAGVAALAEATQLDAVFISCTSLRLASFVDEIEATIGIPVTSSDHAMAWHALRLAGVRDVVPGAGRLFRL